MQSAICARSRRLVRLERATECLISWAVPNFPQALLGGIAERVILVAPLREWRDAAWQCPAIGCDVHDGPRPAAQRPSGATVAALQPNRSKSVRIVCHERRVSIWFATIREILRHETTSLNHAAIKAMVKALPKEAFPLTQVQQAYLRQHSFDAVTCAQLLTDRKRLRRWQRNTVLHRSGRSL